MKANIALEIDKEDLSYELENLVSNIASNQIKGLVKLKAEELVEEEVTRIISPIVDSYLESVLVGEEYPSIHSSRIGKTDVDTYIKRVLQKYLDEPCYYYSKESNTISGKYHVSSDKSTITRAERWINDKVREYTDKELFEQIDRKVEATVQSIIPSKDEIEDIIKREIQNKFK